ncbi:tRNA lysidine(34) synthetase TilS [Vagococcus bubulae]|uniref:tRNA(Ile)-lysidine synthase n=1 Tax=Vagococcus bubulae TaxID=1977868 RepID=A0A429ZCY9_9ENTE|nr:tRNA lysidine(34) synthetase TilS [Vagococcus bubulae]RST91539.1 tRNA lysidine(34) synthetase TilS [Vagococcus bubulae]
MYQEFEKIIQSEYQLTPQTHIVVGVSGGVDSMVLLHLLCQIPKNKRPVIYVAHVNHQLRAESEEEQLFVESYAQTYQIPCFVGIWDEGKTVDTNVEQQARTFRYAFFDKVMQETNSTYLLTAHHKDDAVETILMRWIQGSQLRKLVGIEKTRSLGANKVIRPLLSFSKKELYAYAKEENIPYHEDSSNFSDNYLRNRIRHHIRPMLEKENPNLGEGMLRLSQEISTQRQVIDELLQPLVELLVCYQNNTWQLDYLSLKRHNLAIQSEVIRYVLTDIQEKTSLVVGYEHMNQLQQLIRSDKPNQQVLLGNNWIVEKNYEILTIYQKKESLNEYDVFDLVKNQGVFLSNNQWLGFFELGKEDIPNELVNWNLKEMIYTHGKNHAIRVRKREDGDRFVYNYKGQTKKVSRYFIDEKIPTKLRDLSWLVFDEKGCLLWLLPFRESYLSIQHETDKIQYKLVYLYQGDE